MESMLEKIGKNAKEASLVLGGASAACKNTLLQTIASALIKQCNAIVTANEEDMREARSNGLSPALLDRLLLTQDRVKAIADDVLHIASLPDPVGSIIDGGVVRSGLDLQRRRVPLGVVGVIYEARPNVTIDVASLCLKTGNVAILRGGKETAHTNRALVSCVQRALESCSLPHNCVQLIDSPDRTLVLELVKLDKYIDMIIPRGGSGLQQFCKEQATIPVILGGIGVCHIYVDETANLEKAVPVIENAKVQRPSVCNAVETLLVHTSVAETFLPRMAEVLGGKNVRFHACPKALGILKAASISAEPWDEEQLAREWLSLDLNIGVVNGMDEALAHIRKYSSGHSDAILTETFAHAERFVKEVDSSAVYVNASTRFTDGGEFGLGAEVAVSTQKLHARGPMGLDSLTTWKWVGTGDYLIRK